MAKQSLEAQAEKFGWKLREINREDPKPLCIDDFNDMLKGVANHIRSIFNDMPYGISGAEDYLPTYRDRMSGLFSIYTATHNKGGGLELIDSASVRVFHKGYVLAQCHNPNDSTLKGFCSKMTGTYNDKNGKFEKSDPNPNC